MSETAAPAKRPSRLARAFRALNDRRMAAMLILAFAASIPYGAIVGVLTAWLTQEGVDTDTIGVLSLVTIGYSFKYLWAPLFQTPHGVPFISVGGRRSWLILCQASIAVLLIVLALSNPPQNIGLVALICFVILVLGPTHDIILDAWRIEVARSDEDKDLMSALYQFGYKSGGFISGFVALLVAARGGWVVSYVMMAGFMALTVLGSLLAPEPEYNKHEHKTRLSFLPSVPAREAVPAVTFVALCWSAAFLMIGTFAVRRLGLGEALSSRKFVSEQGPLIVLLTVVVPAVVAATLVVRNRAVATEAPLMAAGTGRGAKLAGTLFRAIFDPLMDLIYRLRWWTILVLALALTYRFTDAVWGSFAYPFYLGTHMDALGHSLDDVAIASKFFGVIATILGSLLGATLIAGVGRMPVFFIGGIIAAVTNLLYADLAAGAHALDAFLAFTHLDGPLVAFANWAATLQPEQISLPADQGQRMARLMITIFAENIAGGFALVAMTAYLTAVVNPRFAAVQYALLASLTMLIGTLGRPWLGEMIEKNGFHDVFIVTFWLGGVAVALSVLEWWRLSRAFPAEAGD
ncbi:MAG: MFS transporter [Hyphomonas sp.]